MLRAGADCEGFPHGREKELKTAPLLSPRKQTEPQVAAGPSLTLRGGSSEFQLGLMAPDRSCRLLETEMLINEKGERTASSDSFT